MDNNISFNKHKYIAFTLREVIDYNHNTKIFRFNLPSSIHTTGMTIASCIRVMFKNEDGDEVSRAYTPITLEDQQGYFDLLVKRYDAGVMSNHIFNLNIGDNLNVIGPFPKIQYVANKYKHIGMIAGGTGITPMLQVIRTIVSNDDDHTMVTLIFANVTEDDILMKEELDLFHKNNKNILVVYTLDKPSDKWNGETGFVSKDMITKYFPLPCDDNIVLCCGPPAMLNHICGPKAVDKSQGELKGLLRDIGYTTDNVYKF